MKAPDLDKERSEKKLSITDFLKFYNENLPARFPRASLSLLDEFKKNNPVFFKGYGNMWTLDQHRKKFMDWLTKRARISNLTSR